jgi:type I restriction enzyme S subunit
MRIAEAGDLLLSVRAPVGEVNQAAERMVIGHGLSALRFSLDDRDFAWHALKWSAGTLNRIAQGSTFVAVSRRDVEELEIPWHGDANPRIAAVLDTVDEAIAKTEAVIAKLKQVRAGLLHDLLTRGLDEHGQLRDPIAHPEQFQDSPLGRIPRDWDVLPLGNVAAVERGKFAHRPRNDPAFYSGRFPFIQTGDIALAAGEVIIEASQSLNDRGASVSQEFPAGTIAVTIAANIGDTAILGRPMFFPDSVVGVMPRVPHAKRWIELTLRQARLRLNALAPQSAQKNINLEILRPLLIPMPTPDEQNRCASVYEGISDQIRLESRVFEKLSSLRSGLMTDLITGRVRVPESISVVENQA